MLKTKFAVSVRLRSSDLQSKSTPLEGEDCYIILTSFSSISENRSFPAESKMKNSWKQKQREGSCQEYHSVGQVFEGKYWNLPFLHFVQYSSLTSLRDELPALSIPKFRQDEKINGYFSWINNKRITSGALGMVSAPTGSRICVVRQ